MKRITVCTTPGCPHLAPCPTHSRPANAPWSKDRDTSEHLRFRRQIIKQRGPACERCGWQAENRRGKGLQLHHVRPGNTPDAVILLCRPCHRTVDKHAR